MAQRSQKSWQELTELVAAFEIYIAYVHLAYDEHLRGMAPLLSQGLAPHRKAVAEGISGPPWPKGLLVGLRQGARESFPGMGRVFRDHPNVIEEIRRAGGETLTKLLAYSEQAARVLKRGKIRSEDEFYVVRARIDEIEGKPEFRTELDGLYAVVGHYESR